MVIVTVAAQIGLKRFRVLAKIVPQTDEIAPLLRLQGCREVTSQVGDIQKVLFKWLPFLSWPACGGVSVVRSESVAAAPHVASPGSRAEETELL